MTAASSAAPAAVGRAHTAVPRKIAAVPKHANNDAAAYLHTAATKAETPNPIGRPAYQKDGMRRVQYETLHANAIPATPHGNATTNNKAVAVDSITVQRNQRPGCPMERLIQPTVLASNMPAIPGPNSWKILPASDHCGPSTSRTTSLPIKVRSALTANPTNAIIPSELARYRLKRGGS